MVLMHVGQVILRGEFDTYGSTKNISDICHSDEGTKNNLINTI